MNRDHLNVAARLAADGIVAVAGGEFLLASSRGEAFGRLFGRDSLITSLQFLSALRLDPTLAPILLPPIEGSLSALACLQGVMDDPWMEEEPGKIPHEYNAGGGGDFPGAYYASVDSTPLFLIVLHEYDAVCRLLRQWDGETGGWGDTESRRIGNGAVRRCGDREMEEPVDDSSIPPSPRHPVAPSGCRLLEALRATRDRAVKWITERADFDGDGLVEFLQRNPEGKSLINQNWKDSRDSLLTPDGQRPLYPVAYTEVQAYCYRAILQESRLRVEDDTAYATHLLEWADRLASVFERRFWMSEACSYAQALDAEKRQLADLTSNAFHWLWLGPIRPRRFRQAARRLLRPDMLTPFGLRTLSSDCKNYEPLRYHRGSIWPWDNWAATRALRRLGMEKEAAAVDDSALRSLVQLGCAAELYVYRDGDPAPSTDFLDYRSQPTHSCRTQAWTVGYLVEMIAREGMGGALLSEVERRRLQASPEPARA